MPKCNFDRDMGVEDAFYTYPGRPWPSAPVDHVFVNKLSNAKSDCFRLNLSIWLFLCEKKHLQIGGHLSVGHSVGPYNIFSDQNLLESNIPDIISVI